MIIDDAVYKQLFNNINNNQQNPVNWDYTATFIDGSTNDEIPVHNVVSIHRISSYMTEISDQLYVSMQVYKSIYMQLIALDRRLLKCQLIRTLTGITGKKSVIGNVVTENYNAFLTDNTSEAIETRSGKLSGNYTDDLGELITIHVQMVEKGLSEFRLWDVGGVYRNCTMKELLQGLMSQPLKALSEDMTKGFSVSVYEPNNTERYYQRLIPNGVRLADLPGWLQKKWGVYSASLGYYLTQGIWYIYPLFDFTRYSNSSTRLTIINVPKNEMMGITNSYYQDGNEIYIFATGDTKHIDFADSQIDRSGQGFKLAKTGNLLDHFHDVKGGQANTPKGRNFVNVSFEQREGELDNIKAVPGLLSSNPWEAASQAIASLINIVKVTWEHSNPYLLYPGMPVKFIYKYRDVPYSLFGILSFTETTVMTYKPNVTDTNYVSSTNLTLSIERATR